MAQKRQVGKVTGVTTAGGGLGAALAQIAVEFIPRLENVEAAVTVVLTVALALVAGYLVPPEHRDVVTDALDIDYDPDEADTEDIDADLDLEAAEHEDELH